MSLRSGFRRYRDEFLSLPAHVRWLTLLALALPFGGKMPLFVDHAYLYGRVGDYLIPEVYAFDIVLLLALWTWRHAARGAASARRPRLFWWGYAGVLLAGLITVPAALYQDIALYRWFRLLLGGGFAWYMSRQVWTRQRLRWLVGPFLAGAVLQSVLAWLQVALQHAVTHGTLAHLIGEPPLSPWTPGISLVRLFGEKVIRPYGTFPHPNVFAGYLVFGLIAAGAGFALFTRRRRLLRLVGLVLFSTLLITLSRTAWLTVALAAAAAPWVFRQSLDPWRRAWRRRLWLTLPALALTAAGLAVAVYRVWMLWGANQISLVGRLQLNALAAEMLARFPLGIGLSHFTIYLRYFDLSGLFEHVIQPVHNVFLLNFAEIGWPGGLSFIVLCAGLCVAFGRAAGRLAPVQTFPLFVGLLTIAVTLFVDHYFWTIAQGQLLFWGMAGLILAADRNVGRSV
jgi:hypothetical protein